MMISPARRSVITFLGLAIATMIVVFPSKAHASPQQMPDPNDFPGQTAYLISAVYGGSYKLDAPISTIRIYIKSTASSVNIKLENGADCYDQNTDRPGSETAFQIWALTADESTRTGVAHDYGGPFGSILSRYLRCKNGVDTITLNSADLAALPLSTVSGHQSYKVVEFEGINFDGTPGWNMFKINDVGAGNITSFYAGTTDHFALKAAGHGVPGSSVGDFTLPFAPSCNVPNGTAATLRWFDADAGQGNQNGETPIPTILNTYNRSTGALVSSTTINVTTGNDVPGSVAIPGGVRSDRTYTWTWKHIYSANGIQFQLPYDSANFYLGCNQPQTAVTSANTTCTVLIGWTVDPDKFSTPLKMEVYADHPRGVVGAVTVVTNYNANQFNPIVTGVSGIGPYIHNHGFNIDISSYASANRMFYLYSWDIDSSGTRVGSAPVLTATQQLGPNCSLSCSINPTTMQTGVVTPAVITISNTGANQTIPDNIDVVIKNVATGHTQYSNPNLYYAGQSPPPGNLTLLAGHSISTPSFNVNVASNDYGAVTVKVLVGGNVVGPCDGSNTVANDVLEPYLRVYGGDVSAGTSDGGVSNCVGWGTDSPAGSAGVYGFTNGSDKGSADQLGVFALGPVDNGPAGYGFSSAVLRSLSPIPPKDLTFANSGTVGNSGLSHCPYDYFNNRSGTATQITNPSVNLGAMSGDYYDTVSTTIGASGPVVMSSSPGRIVALYVNGNVTIRNDITYNGVGTWASKTDIPRVQIVAKGNIYIDKAVKNLDGIYIAQTNGTPNNGTIYTCTNGSSTYTGALTGSLYAQCNNQLTVNGSLIANRIKWERTFGTLNNATSGENPNSGPHNCTSTSVVLKPVCASEVVNLSPEAWYVGQPMPAQQVRLDFDSEIALPPFL